MEEVKRVKREPRRRHSASLKMQLVAACDVPGASVAGVALAHGINANMVHKWRREQQARSSGAAPTKPGQRLSGRRTSAAEAPTALAAQSAPMFVPLSLGPVSAASSDIRVEIRRGGNVVNVSWPASAAQGCAAWLAALIR